MNTCSSSGRTLAARFIGCLAIIALTLSSLRAEDVFVTAYASATSGDTTPCPPSCNTGSVSASGSVAYSLAEPQPPISPRRSRFGFADGCTWSVTPDGSYSTGPLQSSGVYKIYITMPANTSCSSDILVNMTATGGDLADTNGLAATAVPVTAFRSTSPIHTWIHVGYITNNVASPTVTFTWVSGTLASAVRWYMDAVRFENIGDPCSGVAGQVGINGPLVQNQLFVNVTGVAAGATNVTVYADSAEIGSTNYAAGFAAGALTVPVSPLYMSAQITAGQIKNGCSSQVPLSGPVVGGGPNPQVRILLGMWKNATNAGPIGANSTAPPTGFPYILGSSGFLAGFGSAPLGGRTLVPSQCWQTVTFHHGSDPAIDLNSGTAVSNTDPFCSLEGLVFSIDSTDTGPYEIYVDQLMNGDVLVENFESYAVGTTNTFHRPAAAAQPPAGAAYLGMPNSTLVSANHAFDGTQSSRIQWQWRDALNTRWAHVQANAPTGKRYPQIDTRLPITLRVLVLPVGETTARKFNGTVGNITNASPAWATGINTIGVAVTGTGSYTYQWTWSGGFLGNQSDLPTYTIDGYGGGMSSFDNGVYTVTISDGTCTESRSVQVTVLDPAPTITNQPPVKTIRNVGGNFILSVGADGHVAAGYPLNYQWRFNEEDIPGANSDTYSTNNVQVANAGYYTVVVGNNYGYTTSRVATLDVVAAGVVVGTGTGLRGDYYSARTNGVNEFGVAPTLSRIDPTVDFAWGTGSPDPLITSDYFMVRWHGQVQALDTDTYTFYMLADDGVRLWIDDQLVINHWLAQAPTERSGSIPLTANQKYNLVLEYFERASGAVAHLSWSGAGGGVVKEIVPTSQLYPAAGPMTPALTLGLNNGTNLVLNWGAGSHALVWATNVAGPYTNVVPNVVSPHTIVIDPSAPQRFYRVRAQ